MLVALSESQILEALLFHNLVGKGTGSCLWQVHASRCIKKKTKRQKHRTLRQQVMGLVLRQISINFNGD